MTGDRFGRRSIGDQFGSLRIRSLHNSVLFRSFSGHISFSGRAGRRRTYVAAAPFGVAATVTITPLPPAASATS